MIRSGKSPAIFIPGNPMWWLSLMTRSPGRIDAIGYNFLTVKLWHRLVPFLWRWKQCRTLYFFSCSLGTCPYILSLPSGESKWLFYSVSYCRPSIFVKGLLDHLYLIVIDFQCLHLRGNGMVIILTCRSTGRICCMLYLILNLEGIKAALGDGCECILCRIPRVLHRPLNRSVRTMLLSIVKRSIGSCDIMNIIFVIPPVSPKTGGLNTLAIKLDHWDTLVSCFPNQVFGRHKSDNHRMT